MTSSTLTAPESTKTSSRKATNNSGKLSEDHNVSITLPDHIYQYFNRAAEADERPLSRYLAREIKKLYEANTANTAQQISQSNL